MKARSLRVYRARAAEQQTYHSNPIAKSAVAPRGPYALKILREQFSTNRAALARLRREAFVGRTIAHRHIVSILSVHVHQPPYYVVMPCLDGQTVATALAHGRMFSLPHVLWICAKRPNRSISYTTPAICTAISSPPTYFSRRACTSHSSISAARRIDEEPALDDRSPSASALVGTPAYLAPEIFAGHTPDVRSDLYSLGMTLFEMLAGRLPWPEIDLAALSALKRSGPNFSVRTFAPQVPPSVDRLVSRLTATHPMRRPHSARDIVQRLVELEIATLARYLEAG